MTDGLQKKPAGSVGQSATSNGSGSDVGQITGLMRLSPRERQVVALRCDHYTAQEIGAQLGIAAVTVYQHLDKARMRTNSVSVGELLRRARLLGVCS